MSLEQQVAKNVYAILIECTGASSEKEAAFVEHYTSSNPSSEWRLASGLLGFGGKFRYPSLKVDVYPEDETPQRLEIIKKTNEALAALR